MLRGALLRGAARPPRPPQPEHGASGECGAGLGWASLLDDGGQLCAEVLAVEPLLKQDIRGVSYVVPAREKDGQPVSYLGSLRVASLGPSSAC